MFLQIFGQVIIPIIIVFITLAVIKKILENGLKKVDKVKEKLKNDNIKNEYEDINKYILIIVSISAILYLLLIAKIVPFLSIRYFLLIVPFIYILITYIFKFVMETLVQKEIFRISIIIVIIIGYMLASLSTSEKNEFLYKGSNDMYKNIENTGVKDIIYYYKNFYEVNSDITRYINGYNIYFSEIDKIGEKNNSSIEEIKKKDRINVFLYNTHLDKIDEILQKLDGKYKIIKENKTFYGKMYLLSK